MIMVPMINAMLLHAGTSLSVSRTWAELERTYPIAMASPFDHGDEGSDSLVEDEHARRIEGILADAWRTVKDASMIEDDSSDWDAVVELPPIDRRAVTVVVKEVRDAEFRPIVDDDIDYDELANW